MAIKEAEMSNGNVCFFSALNTATLTFQNEDLLLFKWLSECRDPCNIYLRKVFLKK